VKDGQLVLVANCSNDSVSIDKTPSARLLWSQGERHGAPWSVGCWIVS
jgi:hypothetical protein